MFVLIAIGVVKNDNFALEFVHMSFICSFNLLTQDGAIIPVCFWPTEQERAISSSSACPINQNY